MTSVPPLKFNEPARARHELDYVHESIESGRTASGGPFSERAAAFLRDEAGASEALLTTSCTAALEMSAMLLDLQPGDTVIVPSFTFTSSALAFAREGARILFCDIEPRTLGPDPAHVAELLDESVRAVVVVHYAGIPGDISGLLKVLEHRPDVAIVEDNAHGLFGQWQGRPLGSIGRFSTLSFHETKNIACGEGGALILQQPEDVDRAWVLFEKGTDRRAFFQGAVDKYSWRDTGSSFAIADLLAALLLARLEDSTTIQAERRRVFDGYLAALAPYEDSLGIRLPVVPDECVPAYHLFHVLLPDPVSRGEIIAGLREQGIPTAFHYVPLHDSTAGRRFAARPTECPVSVDVSSRLLRLPFHGSLKNADIDRVATALTNALGA